MYVAPRANLKPRLSWRVFKNGKTKTWHIYGVWGLTEWRRSSPIQEITEDREAYYAKTLSGSSYILIKEDEQEESKMSEAMQEISDGALR